MRVQPPSFHFDPDDKFDNQPKVNRILVSGEFRYYMVLTDDDGASINFFWPNLEEVEKFYDRLGIELQALKDSLSLLKDQTIKEAEAVTNDNPAAGEHGNDDQST